MAERSESPAIPTRLVQWLAMWDYIVEVLTDRVKGLTDEEFLWEPAPRTWSVRPNPSGGRNLVEQEVWAPTGDPAPPRTIAWSMGHLGSGVAMRADWLVGSHSLTNDDFDWPLAADAGIRFMFDGLSAWRNGLATMTDKELDTVGRSAFPGGLDPELPLIDIVWWVTKELTWHAAEIWYVRDQYAARQGAG
ncbi:MAG TPA: DinB family protein [Candidatus Limnocylindrales bacterium]|jgi:DinB superfamily